MCEFLTAPPLAALDGVVHGFFTRRGGVSTGIYEALNCGPGSDDDPAAVAENRRRVTAALGLERAPLVSLHQVHSAEALTLAAAPDPQAPRARADAMATDRSGFALGILTADCAPVLLADPHARVIGAAHAGWGGAFTGVLEAAVSAMAGLGAAPQRIVAAIGPTIGPASYEVGPDFVARATALDARAEGFFRPGTRPGHPHFDLPGYVAERLRAAGLATVHDLARDTYADEAGCFSYRRATHRGEPDYGRMVAAIALAGG
jgi:YfiH family protein